MKNNHWIGFVRAIVLWKMEDVINGKFKWKIFKNFVTEVILTMEVTCYLFISTDHLEISQ